MGDKYYKIFRKNDMHNNFKYRNGLNTDTVEFNTDPYAGCVAGGLYFSDIYNLHHFMDGAYGDYIRVVEPQGKIIEVNDTDSIKYRAHSLFLNKRKSLRLLSTWRWLKEEGLDLQNQNIMELCGRFCNQRIVDYIWGKKEVNINKDASRVAYGAYTAWGLFGSMGVSIPINDIDFLTINRGTGVKLPFLSEVDALHIWCGWEIDIPALEQVHHLELKSCVKINLPKLKNINRFHVAMEGVSTWRGYISKFEYELPELENVDTLVVTAWGPQSLILPKLKNLNKIIYDEHSIKFVNNLVKKLSTQVEKPITLSKIDR